MPTPKFGWIARVLLVSLNMLPGHAKAQAGLESTETHAHSLASATWLGDLQPAERVDVTVVLRLRNRDQLKATAQAVTDPDNPSYGRWLNRDDIARDYAPSVGDVNSVTDYLSKAGLVNVRIAGDRLSVMAQGSPEALRSAFHTRLGHFRRHGREGIANFQDAQVPAALGGRVLAVLGLQTLEGLRSMNAKAAAVQLSGSVHGLNPVTFPQAYNAVGLPAATSTSVGIIAEGNLTQTVADLHSFESNNALPTIHPTLITVGRASSDTSGTAEWDLDSQTIQAMAGGQVRELRFYAAFSFLDADIFAAIDRAVTDNVANVINISLGECESVAQADGALAADDQLFNLAQAQGQTVAVSSGDSGASECGTPAGTAIGASYPASSPYVIAVGGTTLTTDASGNYVAESAWSGGGGSPSLIEPKPAWQSPVVSGSFRGLPDIAFDADPNSGAIIVVNGATAQYGGTSLAAPLFVASWARIQTANNARLGLPARWIYARGQAGSAVFHDVTTGSNGAYAAAAGWDYTTGFGSFDVSATAALTRSAVVVTSSSASNVPGQTVTLTATVIGNFPTGTVQFQINGVNFGPLIPLLNGVASLSSSALTLNGSEVITAIYSGDANNAGSRASLNVATIGSGADGDVPLPAWALRLLGSGLSWTLWRRRTRPMPTRPRSTPIQLAGSGTALTDAVMKAVPDASVPPALVIDSSAIGD